MSGSNIVPMPKPTAPAPMAYPWPMPSGGFPAGCCPPGGMDALLQCYCDIQAATAFISKIVTDLAANDPAFQQALVDAIAKSGSNIPLTGVTNGSNAQPGQVGEHLFFAVGAIPITVSQANKQTITMGVVQPGDWDLWAYLYTDISVEGLQYQLSPASTAGGVFSNLMTAFIGDLGSINMGAGINFTMNTPVARLSTAVPVLVAFDLYTWSATAGFCNLQLEGRRVR